MRVDQVRLYSAKSQRNQTKKVKRELQQRRKVVKIGQDH
ncbi:unnamed protein product (macronuclear) [Paramecium tetraurelia]|uniref:Uncharacterized protein n=1 Tax=Paramecium tetraurelia TaxID=5888 RepID=A0BS40_PARTE|nr:uncharacterized protein GSPATT00031588001 [Paramecium tetraurelia]CAK61357.1 unnamed protein product [Paramecium tetraurelia]